MMKTEKTHLAPPTGNRHAEITVESAYVALARAQYGGTSDLEIDHEPEVSLSEGGAWVSAWVWVDAVAAR